MKTSTTRKEKVVSINAFPYAVINKQGDILSIFKFSESAREHAEQLSKANGSSFSVVMASNIITQCYEITPVKN